MDKYKARPAEKFDATDPSTYARTVSIDGMSPEEYFGRVNNDIVRIAAAGTACQNTVQACMDRHPAGKGRALNDPIVGCCGRDAADCDCPPPAEGALSDPVSLVKDSASQALADLYAENRRNSQPMAHVELAGDTPSNTRAAHWTPLVSVPPRWR